LSLGSLLKYKVSLSQTLGYTLVSVELKFGLFLFCGRKNSAK
jgi:hypothetical protein